MLTDVPTPAICRPKNRSKTHRTMVISGAEPSSMSNLMNTKLELVETNGKKYLQNGMDCKGNNKKRQPMFSKKPKAI